MKSGYKVPRQYRWYTHFLRDAAGKDFEVKSLCDSRLAAIGMMARRYPSSAGYTHVGTR